MTPTFVSMTAVLRAQTEAVQRLAWFVIEHHEREMLLTLKALSATHAATLDRLRVATWMPQRPGQASSLSPDAGPGATSTAAAPWRKRRA